MIDIPWSGDAFTISGVTMRWYSIFITLALATLIVWVVGAARHEPRVTGRHILGAAIAGIPIGIVVSRLIHILDQWQYYSLYPSQIFGGSGLTIWGVVIGATIAIWVYLRLVRAPAGVFFDLMAPGVMLGQIMGRIGCTANGCCYGVATDLPWGIRYLHPYSAGFATINGPVHPVAVYEIIFLALLFGLLLALRRRLRPDGSLYLLYLCLYAAWRIGIGFIRDNHEFVFGLQQAQIIAVVVLVLALPLLVWRMLRRSADDVAPPR